MPVRLQPGSWYALPQSPQLFKQLLMVGGLERYYQFARCFRDEDFRADRQPEFTQLDIEMSFCEQDDVIALGEDILTAIWREVLGVEIATPFPRMTYAEAMRRYGSDKPDTRFGMELVDLTGYFAGTDFKIFASSEHVGAVVVPGRRATTPGAQLDGWNEWSTQPRRQGRRVRRSSTPKGDPGGGIAKNLHETELHGLRGGDRRRSRATRSSSRPGRERRRWRRSARCGWRRRATAGSCPKGGWNFLWVTDAPMFEPTADGGWTSVHHPFTRPRAGGRGVARRQPRARRWRSPTTSC